MRKMVIVNSTPIIVLHTIGRLGILKELYGEVVIPNAVRREVTVKDKHLLDSYDWIHTVDITNTAAKELYTGALHDGEVEVMLLAKERNANLIIMDDGLARRHAKYLNMTVTGTIGVLLRAKDNGLIDFIRPILEKLVQNGFYISDNIYRKVLDLAKE